MTLKELRNNREAMFWALHAIGWGGYGTAHWWQWYKQTRAHNAVTYDGGQGQLVHEAGGYAPGALTRFEHQAAYDIVQGFLGTPIGSMHGTYHMVRPDGSSFEATIAPFSLSMPNALN